jgi:probable F420-dependent oxidoreductase
LDERLPRLGVRLPTYAVSDPGDWQHVFSAARAADSAGVDRVVLGDHVVLGERLENYSRPELGGMAGGQQPTGPDGYWLEPLSVIAAVCGVTSRIRFTTTILLAALRRPVVLAKAAATIDVLSRGRLDLGVGVGWQREEYEAAGLEFDQRGALLDQTLAVMQTVWRDNPASFESDTLRFERIHFLPKPTTPGGVPIWISGTLHRRAINRIVRFGTGWIAWGAYFEDPAPGIEVLKRALMDAGRDPAEFSILATLRTVPASDGEVDLDATFVDVGRLTDAGVTDFRVNLPLPKAEDAATDYLAGVVERFRIASGRAGAWSDARTMAQ